ncbi:MAG: mitochondrial ribosomal small subunit component [Caeruleum heppii]|nr:MAG: mitochondrial ribosomal small subunit component [Caeruleum heppii]
MGRLDLRPLRVHRSASQMLETPRLKTRPPWYDVMRTVPPTQPLIRTLPVQHQERSGRNRTRKASKLFRPQAITYPEDALRAEFFGDHPWELARPRVVLEDDGKNGRYDDWSRIRQARRATDGESVVQRQQWLMQNVPGITTDKAYDQARQEFYAIRHQEEVERRVAREEALATGAYFGKSHLDVGMELEDKQWEEWKAWAIRESAAIQQIRGAVATGGSANLEEIETNDGEDEGAAEEVEASVPSGRGARAALVGPAIPP